MVSPFPKGRSQETKLGIASPRLQPWGLDGGGYKDIMNGAGKRGPAAYYRRLASSSDEELREKYQILCACCNWIKRHAKKEFTA